MNNVISNELVVADSVTALQVFSSDEGLDPFVAKAASIVAEFDHDMSTGESRKKTASLARKISSLKTRLDGMGKDLVSDWKSQAKVVDNSRKKMRDALDELKVEARRPLTEWDEQQDILEAEKVAQALADQVAVCHELGLLMDKDFDRDVADEHQRATITRIAEEKRIAAKAKKVAKKLSELAAQKARLGAQAEIDRLAAAKVIAEEKVAYAARKAKVVKKQAKEDAKKAAETARLAEVQRQKDAAEAEQRAVEKREANKRHVARVMKEAEKAIARFTESPQYAKSIVEAIKAGEIAHVSISF